MYIYIYVHINVYIYICICWDHYFDASQLKPQLLMIEFQFLNPSARKRPPSCWFEAAPAAPCDGPGKISCAGVAGFWVGGLGINQSMAIPGS